MAMKPKEVKRYEDIAKLKHQIAESKKSWLVFKRENEIVIHNQVLGEKSTGEVVLTRREFQKFVDWWEGK